MYGDEFPPAPGSDEAGELGCVCPVMDNAHGRGYMGGALFEGEPIFVMRLDCPMHGIDARNQWWQEQAVKGDT